MYRDYYEEIDEVVEAEELDEELDEALDEHIYGELSEEDREILTKSVLDRTPQEFERVDAIYHPDYRAQVSHMADETGDLIRDEEGHALEVSYGSPNSLRPDLYREGEDGQSYLREDKVYHDYGNLVQNIRDQDLTREAYGEDADITYVVAPTFTFREAEKLQELVEEELEKNLEWQYK